MGPPHPTLIWSQHDLEPATQQRLFAYEAETMLTKLLLICGNECIWSLISIAVQMFQMSKTQIIDRRISKMVAFHDQYKCTIFIISNKTVLLNEYLFVRLSLFPSGRLRRSRLKTPTRTGANTQTELRLEETHPLWHR